MDIAIIGGTGKEGRGIALRWARAGHQVKLGSRDAERARQTAAELNGLLGTAGIEGGDNRWAVSAAAVALLAVPYGAHHATLESLREALVGKVLVDITVPLRPPQVSRVQLPEGQSAALEAQALLGDAVQVVATLHHVSAAHLADLDHAIECDVLACSDSPQAMATTLQLLSDLGARGLDGGKLCNSIALESLTPVLIHLNKRYKSPGTGLRITGIASGDPS